MTFETNQPVPVTLLKGDEDILIAGIQVETLAQLPWPHRVGSMERDDGHLVLVIDGWLATSPLSPDEQALLSEGEMVLAVTDAQGEVSLRMAVLCLQG